MQEKTAARKKAPKSPEYQAWCAMRGRCYNINNHAYHNYGGRGITVCAAWMASFGNFIADMGPRPSNKHSVDRIDVNGNYEPGNCRWATSTQQSGNKRTSITLTYQGETRNFMDWVEKLGLDGKVARKRLNAGLPLEIVFSSDTSNYPVANFKNASRKLKAEKMDNLDISPAARVIAAFGGVRATARILDVSSSTVSRWQKARAEGGTGGCVPTKHQKSLLELAKARGIELTPADLIC